MSEVSVIYRTTGLNNLLEPGAIPADHETGVSALATAVDVVITDALKIERRRPIKQVIAGDFHSGYCHASPLAVCVQEITGQAALMRINPDLTLTGLRDGLTKNRRMSFVRAGQWHYYTNGRENGVIKEDGLSYIWPTYDIPEKVTGELSAAPVGDKLAFLSGRIFVVVGDTIYWSLPHEPGLFDLEWYSRFKSRILMIKPVLAGMFVSTETETFFLPGIDPEEWSQVPVLPYPAKEWADATDYIQASRLGIDATGNAAVWFSENGVIAGLPSGGVANLTEKEIVFPEVETAAGLIYNNKFIYTMR